MISRQGRSASTVSTVFSEQRAARRAWRQRQDDSLRADRLRLLDDHATRLAGTDADHAPADTPRDLQARLLDDGRGRAVELRHVAPSGSDCGSAYPGFRTTSP